MHNDGTKAVLYWFTGTKRITSEAFRNVGLQDETAEHCSE